MTDLWALSDVKGEELVAAYGASRLDELSDARLVLAAAQVLALPLATEEGASSFALHAPLELLARFGLLAYVAPAWRRAARLRVLSLVSGYLDAGEKLASRPSTASPGADAAAQLRAAISSGDLAEVDRLGLWASTHFSATQLRQALAEDVLGHLGAAGHANIYFDLAADGPMAGVGPLLLWPVARELAKSPGRSMVTAMRHRSLLGEGRLSPRVALSAAPLVGPATAWGIAGLVEKAEETGAVAEVLSGAGAAIEAQPLLAGRDVLRVAAGTMLQGPAEHAPYGWTHCLTLSQAAMAQAGALADASRATAVATAYVTAHWSCLARAPFDPDWEPEPVAASFPDALGERPMVAASSVWHVSAEQLAEVPTVLATRAAAAHDAHHVKYTLACIRAAAVDPGGSRLFLAAAAYLAAWWAERGDDDDPLAAQALGPDGGDGAASPPTLLARLA